MGSNQKTRSYIRYIRYANPLANMKQIRLLRVSIFGPRVDTFAQVYETHEHATIEMSHKCGVNSFKILALVEADFQLLAYISL